MTDPKDKSRTLPALAQSHDIGSTLPVPSRIADDFKGHALSVVYRAGDPDFMVMGPVMQVVCGTLAVSSFAALLTGGLAFLPVLGVVLATPVAIATGLSGAAGRRNAEDTIHELDNENLARAKRRSRDLQEEALSKIQIRFVATAIADLQRGELLPAEIELPGGHVVSVTGLLAQIPLEKIYAFKSVFSTEEGQRAVDALAITVMQVRAAISVVEGGKTGPVATFRSLKLRPQAQEHWSLLRACLAETHRDVKIGEQGEFPAPEMPKLADREEVKKLALDTKGRVLRMVASPLFMIQDIRAMWRIRGMELGNDFAPVIHAPRMKEAAGALDKIAVYEKTNLPLDLPALRKTARAQKLLPPG